MALALRAPDAKQKLTSDVRSRAHTHAQRFRDARDQPRAGFRFYLLRRQYEDVKYIGLAAQSSKRACGRLACIRFRACLRLQLVRHQYCMRLTQQLRVCSAQR